MFRLVFTFPLIDVNIVTKYLWKIFMCVLNYDNICVITQKYLSLQAVIYFETYKKFSLLKLYNPQTQKSIVRVLQFKLKYYHAQIIFFTKENIFCRSRRRLIVQNDNFKKYHLQMELCDIEWESMTTNDLWMISLYDLYNVLIWLFKRLIFGLDMFMTNHT